MLATDDQGRVMRMIRHFWRGRTRAIASNEAQWRVINEGAARERTLRAALAALVNDDFNAWGASVYESHWECNYCYAHGADISGEPRVGDHAATCPWLAARALVGHTVPTEEEDDGE